MAGFDGIHYICERCFKSHQTRIKADECCEFNDGAFRLNKQSESLGDVKNYGEGEAEYDQTIPRLYRT